MRSTLLTKILKSGQRGRQAEKIYHYARHIKGRWPEGEPIISKDAEWACLYAWAIIKGRWPEAEPTISKNPRWACKYADNVIKGRWPEAEPTISQGPRSAYWYARNVIKGRWPEAEKTISTDLGRAYNYAFRVIKGRWLEFEALLCDVSLVKFDQVKEYVSKIDWASPLNDFPIPKRIKRAIK